MTTNKSTRAAAREPRWSAKELDRITRALELEASRLRVELDVAEGEFGTNIADMLNETGDEVADVGTPAL